ncbi:MAG: DHH family phosphoesterase [Planctomycetota bacterium]|jgi:phosphoesterase RecJ-like protein
MVSNDRFQKAVQLINESNSVLITTHTRPDGDACACVVAVADALSALGKKVKTLFLSEIPEWYDFLFDKKPPILGADVTLDQLKQDRPDLVIIVDTNSNSQLPRFEDYLARNSSPVLVIDHHVTADGLGDVELVDSAASSVGLIVCDLFKYADWPITPEIARALFVAVATDTGWFHFTNADAGTFRAAADLIDAGADASTLYHDLYQNFSYARFRLMVAALDSLELYLDGRYAAVSLTLDDFERTGAAHRDTENLIDECRRIGSVEVAALFVELNDGRIRCSLRSMGAVDVSKIAREFEGGGHKMAAGAFLPAPLENAKKLILGILETHLARGGG